MKGTGKLTAVSDAGLAVAAGKGWLRKSDSLLYDIQLLSLLFRIVP